MQKKKIEKEQLVKKFSEGISQLEEVLDGLGESDLDQCREPGKWSIRQIVHHIAESEVLWNTALKAALANPGCIFDFNWYIADNICAGPLFYHKRPIKESLALFRASRKQVLELLHLVDRFWEQSLFVQHENMGGKRKFAVEEIVQWQDKHLRLHIIQIKKSLKKPGTGF